MRRAMTDETAEIDKPDTTAIVWFRRDLRLADNPALQAAVEGHSRVIGVFVHDPALLQPSGVNRVVFLHGCLDALDAFLPPPLVSPIQLARMHGKERQRAGTPRRKATPKSTPPL